MTDLGNKLKSWKNKNTSGSNCNQLHAHLALFLEGKNWLRHEAVIVKVRVECFISKRVFTSTAYHVMLSCKQMLSSMQILN